jgi:glyoxylase-like metal-dependent hydrolase (beta-lactamase superfamily II)
MKRVADDVFQIAWFTRFFSAYLVGDVLVDSGTRFAGGIVLRAVRGRELRAHALTHVHPDHAGSSARVCRTRDVPLWCGAGDADAFEAGRSNYPDDLFHNAFGLLRGPARAVDRRLGDGDELAAGFVAVETPGHSPGHLSFWRDSDRTLLAGEVAWNYGFERRPILRLPLGVFRGDDHGICRSARRLAALEPARVLFSHGRPASGAAFQAFVAGLPAGDDRQEE